jgi:Holliday junction resolvase RusA-like endonuclease
MSAPLLAFTVDGHPAPQGSKRGFVNKHTGRVVMREQSDRLGPWREAVKNRALAAAVRLDEVTDATRWVLDEPVVADMVFTFARPRSHYRTGRNAHLLRDGAPARPDGAPDLSKLARAVEDALTDAGVWRDDARVVEYGRLAKVYAREDGDALDRPGAVIRVWRLSDLITDWASAPEPAGTLFDAIPEGASA